MERWPVNDSVTALAGGGQPGATVLRARTLNRVTTVATAADSVMLPIAYAGEKCDVVNATANAMALFPQSGETINALAADAVLSIAAGKALQAFCPVNGKWYVVLSA